MKPHPTSAAGRVRLAARMLPRAIQTGSRARGWPGLLGVAAFALAAVAGLGCGGRAVIDPELQTTSSTTGQGGTTTTTTSVGAMGGGGSGGAGGTYVPPIDALVERDLGQAGPDEEITFDVEAGLLGMTLVAEIPSEYSVVGIEQLVAPDGTAIIDDFIIESTMWPFQNYGMVAAAVPQSDHAQAMPIMDGPWSVSPYSEFSGAPVDLTVWTRQTVDGAFHGGVIDVNVFRVPSAASESYLTDLVERAFDDWAGLDAGKITFFELSDQFAIIDEYNAWELFLRTSQAERRPSLNVMVVSDFAGDLVGAGGFSVGQPGFPLQHGTLLSGVVMLTYDPDFDVLVLRHEAGHLAGVYHTSEIEEGGFQDHLDDTPFCDDPWTLMESCPDFDNLMFPIAGSLAMELSPKQQRIVQGSLLYRAIVQAGDPPVPPLEEASPDEDGAAPAAPSSGAGAAPAGPSRLPPAAATRVPSRPSEQPWAAQLSPPLAALLYGHWSGELGTRRLFAQTAQLAHGDRELLWSVAMDARAPERVRSRALVTLGYLAPDAELRRRLARVSASRLAPARLRVAALGALAAARAPELEPVARSLRRDANRLIGRAAQRWLDHR